MAIVVVTLRMMPEGVETDLDKIEQEASNLIKEFGGTPGKTNVEPIAFGLKSVDILFTLPEEKGSTEPLEEQISKLDGVQSAEVTDVRRAIG